MRGAIQFVGPNHAMVLFGVKLVGFKSENAKKLLFTVVLILLIWLFAWGIGSLAAMILGGRSQRKAFWTRQAIHLFSAALLVIGLCSIWFDNPARLATALGLVTAGLAFALQRVVTAVAGYIVILRGKTFNVGDRIVMGGVRGDVIELGFIQTTIMEMGEPPSVQNADPAMWVKARQYTGRIVTISNDKIFDTPVYNFTREFAFIWEEMMIPIPYQADLKRAEMIVLEAARAFTADLGEVGEAALAELERRYFVPRAQFEARTFLRLTDNWIEISVRFVTPERGIREVKDKMSRQILTGFQNAGIPVASGTYEVVGMPPISVTLNGGRKGDQPDSKEA